MYSDLLNPQSLNDYDRTACSEKAKNLQTALKLLLLHVFNYHTVQQEA